MKLRPRNLVSLAVCLLAQTALASTTQLQANPSGTVALSATVTLTATVTPIPAGKAQFIFLDGANVLAVGSGTGGSAVFTTNQLSGGIHSLQARYISDGTVPTSISAPVSITVTGLGSTSVTSPGGGASTTIVGPAITAVTGDFNGDGRTDVVVSTAPTGFQVLLGDGAGGFVVKGGTSQASIGEVTAIATADFDGDGILDLAVLSNTLTTFHPILQIYTGKGDGAFNQSQSFQLTTTLGFGLAAGDFDKDGLADVVIGQSNSGSTSGLVSFFHGTGDGKVDKTSEVDTTVGFEVGQIAAGNFISNDPNLDLVVISASTNTLPVNVSPYFLTGDGTGHFSVTPLTPNENFEGPAIGLPNNAMLMVADFNGDGLLDFAGISGKDNKLLWFQNLDAGSFKEIDLPLSGGLAAAAVTGDFNGDGVPDIISIDTSTTNGAVVVTLGKNDGVHYNTFSNGGIPALSFTGTAAVNFKNGGAPVFADVNADGRMDLVAATYTGKNLLVQLGVGPNITGLTPPGTVAGAQKVTIQGAGTHFTKEQVVWNGSTQVPTFGVTSTAFSFTPGNNLLASAATATVQMKDPSDPSLGTSNTVNFTINPAPSITSLSTSAVIAGSPGFTLTVSGANFNPGSTLVWSLANPVPASFANPTITANSISAFIPATSLLAANSGTIQVSDPSGAASNTATFSVIAGPVIASLSTTSVSAGSPDLTLTITGTNFNAGSTVQWTLTNPSPTFTPSAITSTSIIVTIPHANLLIPAQGNIVVVDPSTVQSLGSPFIIVPPIINSISPLSVPAGSPSFQLTVTGSNFIPNPQGSTSGSQILFNGQALTTTGTSTSLSATIPASAVSNVGNTNVNVQVKSPDTSSFPSSSPPTLAVQLPTLASVTPNATAVNSLSAVQITVTGNNFISGSKVFWCNGCGNTPNQLATTFTSSTQLVALVDPTLLTQPATATITVENTPGQNPTNASTNFLTFTTATLTITQLSQTSALAGGPGFSLTISGQNFENQGGTLPTVQFGSVTKQATGFNNLTTPNTITVAILPSDIAVPGVINVSVVNPDGSTSNTVQFTIGQLSITQVSPIVAGQPTQSINISGTSLSGNTQVNWLASTAGSPTPTSTALQASFDPVHQTFSALLPASLVTLAGSAFIQLSMVVNNTTVTSAPFPVSILGPAISTITPTAEPTGAAAFQMTVTGSNFLGSSAVQWNGNIRPTNFVSGTELIAFIPASDLATSGVALVTVKNVNSSGTGSVSNNSLFVIGAPPTINLINGISPSTAAAGQQQLPIAITGTNYTPQSKVNWSLAGTTTTLLPVFTDPQDLTVTIPAALLASPGTVLVTVVNTDGTTSNAAQFTISSGPIPTFTSFTPAGGVLAGGPAFTLTLIGSNFNQGATLNWTLGNTQQPPIPTTFVNSGQLTAVIPASAIAQPGTASIGVVDAGGGTSGVLPFNVSPQPVPTITSFVPAAATAGSGAFSMTINGANFVAGGGLTVNFTTATGTTSVSTVQFINSSELSVLVPASVIATGGTVLVNVVNPGPVTGPPSSFPVNAQPQIAATSGLSPSSATSGGPSFTLTVTGSGFIGTSVVEWGGNDLPTIPLSSTQLAAQVDTTLLVAGTVPVIVRNPGSPSPLFSNAALFTIAAGAVVPRIATSGGLSQTSVTTGSPGFTITVTGSNFISTAVVNWLAGSAVTPLTTAFVSSTQLTAVVPANLVQSPATVFIQVQNSTGVVSNLATFVVSSVPPPAIISMTPTTVAAGSSTLQLSITGTNFQTGAAVMWNTGGGAQALLTGATNNTQLTALVPASMLLQPGIAFVQVQNPDKQVSNSQTFLITGQPPNAVPTVSTITPTSAPAGTGSVTLTVTGTNFTAGINGTGASVVQWNGTALPTTFVSATSISAIVSNTLLATPGNNFVNVVNGTAQSNGTQFTIAGPTITSLNPASVNTGGPGFTMTVIGTNFVNGSTVSISGSSVPTAFVSSTQLTAQISAQMTASPGTALVLVTNPGGAASNPQTLTMAALVPVLSSLSPSTAPAGGPAFQLVVTGSSFISGSLVVWNGTQLATTFVSATQINALVDSSLLATAGTASVTVLNPGGASSTPAKFTITAPTIASACLAAQPGQAQGQSQGCVSTYPALGPNAVGPGIQLTITGTNFLAGSSVQWNATPLPTVFVNATSLTAYVAANFLSSPLTASITVQNPGGAVSAPAIFTVGPFTLAISTTQLPDAIVGLNYGPLILQASGGTSPYTWSITAGALPAGLVLDPNTGSISGIASVAGTATLGLTVTDSNQRTATRTLPMRIVAALTISTLSQLPATLANAPASITFAATGGTPPYKWSTSGNLPSGLAIDPSSGLMSGIPTSPGNYQFSVTVSDSGSNGGQITLPKIFNLQITVPDLAIGGIGAASQPATQPQINVSVTSPYAGDLTGTLTISFSSAVGVDDPNIAFSSGGRTVSFTIPAGSTVGNFGQAGNVALLTGTVAGNITIKATIKSGGSDVTPNPAPQIVTAIAKLAPVITNVTLTTINGGVAVGLTGFSTTRDATTATFTFSPKPGSSLNSSTQTVDLSKTFQTWFASTESAAFGSQFTISIPFGISGDVSAIGSVTVTLSNSVGASTAATANLQ